MKVKSILAVIFSILVLSGANSYGVPKISNKPVATPVVAKVNGVALTEIDWYTEYQELLPGGGEGYHGNIRPERAKELRAEAFKKMIEAELKYQDAVKKKIKVTNKELDDAQKVVENRFKSKEDFLKALKGRKATISDLKKGLKREILIKRINQLEVDDKVKVTEGEMKEFYENNRNIFVRPEEFRASHILVRVDPATGQAGWDEGEKKAKEILAKIRKGESFEDLAREFSDDKNSKYKGGDVGFFHQGMTIEPFNTTATSELKQIGQVSDPVRTIYGFHIIKLTGKKNVQEQTYEQVKDSIFNILANRKKEKLTADWIEGLKNNAKIEILVKEDGQQKK